MLEAQIMSMAEKSVVAGAFLFLLYYFINRNATAMTDISTTLKEVASTLLKIDIRIENMDKRITDLENKVEGGGK